MTGSDIQGLRRALDMSVAQFAGLLGVHVATAYRWEAAGAGRIRLDPLHVQVLAHLQSQVESHQRRQALQNWRGSLLRAVLLGGTLAGLAVLLAGLEPPVAGRRRR